MFDNFLDSRCGDWGGLVEAIVGSAGDEGIEEGLSRHDGGGCGE